MQWSRGVALFGQRWLRDRKQPIKNNTIVRFRLNKLHRVRSDWAIMLPFCTLTQYFYHAMSFTFCHANGIESLMTDKLLFLREEVSGACK